MNIISKNLFTGLLLTLIIPTTALGDDFSLQKFDNINICGPFKTMENDLLNEKDQLNPAQVESKISQLSHVKKSKISDISSKKNKLQQAANKFGSLQQRLIRLSNHMDQEVALLQGIINQSNQQMNNALIKKKKNQKKKDDCKSGIFGSICRKKYRGRIKDAENEFNKAKNKKIKTSKKMANLPNELQALPGKISQSQSQVEFLQSELVIAETAKPTINELNKRIDHLYTKLNSIQNALSEIQEQLIVVGDSLAKCRHIKKLAKAYPVLIDHAQMFKSNPALCNNLSTLVNLAEKPAQKKGITDAHKIVCEGTAITNDDSGFQDNVTILDKIIESPLGENGEYKNNFRDSDYQPKFVDQVGGSDVKQIKINVDFDIEEHYDYLLIKDAQNQIIEKIDGTGQKEILINSNQAKFFFYSDGRSAGKGFIIDQIEVII